MQTKANTQKQHGFAIYVLFAALTALQFGDLHSSMHDVSIAEQNKLIVTTMKFIPGIAALSITKVIDLAVIYLLFRVWRKRPEQTALIGFVLLPTVLIYSAVVFNNYFG
jgi:hypothetical protein